MHMESDIDTYMSVEFLLKTDGGCPRDGFLRDTCPCKPKIVVNLNLAKRAESVYFQDCLSALIFVALSSSWQNFAAAHILVWVGREVTEARNAQCGSLQQVTALDG